MAILKKSLSVLAVAAMAAFLFTATTGCDDGSVTITEPIEPDDGFTVIFDNFGIHKDGTADADTGFTNQTNAGMQLIDYLAGKGNENYPGGSGWYAYASNNGARIYVYDSNTEPDYIVDSAGSTADDDVVMEKMQGDSTLTVVFDCKDESIANPNPLGYYYAGIGAPIGGVKDSLGDLADKAEVVDGSVYWDFSGLKSISVKGSVQGSIIMFFEYKVDKTNTAFKDGVWGYHCVHIAGAIDEATDIDTTYEITGFTPVKDTPIEKSGLSWNDGKGAVSAFVIELDTEATEGGDFAIVKLDEIKFNFDTADSKSDAFPWID